VNVLVPCGGKWVGMVLQLQAALGDRGKVLVADRDVLTPAGCFSADSFRVPGIADPGYHAALLQICKEQDVGVLVPLLDIDLDRLAPHLDEFAAVGTKLISPPPRLVDLCLDKVQFDDFCRANDLSVPPRWTADALDDAPFPLFYRRRRGFGSIGAGLAETLEDARRALADCPDLIFHEVVTGEECSVDCYINADGHCTVRVPRVRDKVVGGEAWRSHTIEDPAVAALADRTVAALAREGLRGPLNIQLFRGDSPSLIEVNTRLGSCSVLSNQASGGRILASILTEAGGDVADGDPDDYERELWIYRYLGDVFHQGPTMRAAFPGTE
jgi:carbamoyl-phosphate synthase large subunit